MTITFALQATPARRFDFGLLSQAFLGFGLLMLLVSPLAADPIEFAAGAFVPWLVLRIIDTPTMPTAMVFWLIWQWFQTFSRALVGLVDDTPMAHGVYGPAVEDAYWYMLASIVAMAAAVRMALGSLQGPTEREATWHLNWRPVDLFLVYLGAFVLHLCCLYAVRFLPSLYQPIDAVAKFKIAAAFVLFAAVMSHGRGYQFMLAAVGMELVMGFTGLLSDFRSVFIVLAMSALATRVRISWPVVAAGAGWLAVLVMLSLFWTAVKMDYREFATGATGMAPEEETQEIATSFDERIGFLADRALSATDIDWAVASYALLTRIAYVDIFGAVISVNQFYGDQGDMRQWSDALSHVFQPRFLFPDKPGLSDTNVYIRLTRADPTENDRINTSISVGFLGENYADLQFPSMLTGVFAIGFLIAGIARYFMSTPLPWMVRQALVLAFVYAAAGTGVEISLPKIIGSAVMFGAVYAMLIRFLFPAGMRWLDIQVVEERRRQERMRRAALASAGRPTLKIRRSREIKLPPDPE